jgi:hypothetical protein
MKCSGGKRFAVMVFDDPGSHVPGSGRETHAFLREPSDCGAGRTRRSSVGAATAA